MYELFVRRTAEKVLDNLRAPHRDKVIAAVLALRDDPRPAGCKKLVDDIYRIRVGPYRVIYLVNDVAKEVDVGKVDRRKERTYKDLETLFR